MSAQLFFLPYQVATVNGIAQSGAKLYFYTTGTTTPQPIYSNSGLSVPLTNPVTANGAGRFPDIYLDSTVVYRLIVKDSADTTLEDVDPYTPGTIDVVGFVADGDKGDVAVSGGGATWTVEGVGGVAVSAFAKTILDDADAAAVRATIGAGAGSGDLAAANNLSDLADIPTARDNLDVPSNDDLAGAIATVVNSGGGVLNGFVSGGQAIWNSGFQYTVTAASFYIAGTLYTSAEQTITLDAADGTFDRIDVLALDNTGTLVKITGTAAAAPSEPDIDASTQIEITFVIVATGTTAPATATTESVYLEDAQWTSSITSGTHINKASTSNPRTGTKCIEATSAVTNDVLLLNKGSAILASSYTNLVFYLRNKTASWGTSRIRFHFRNAAGTRVGSIITVSNGTFGFSTSNTTTYQAVSIPMTAFAVPAGTSIQSLNVAVNGTTAIGWYMDDVILQLNGAGTGSGSGLTQTQADARYAQRSANLSDLASASTARTNLGITSANVKLTESFIIACSDESTAITTGTAKATFRMPYAFTVSDVRASVNTAPTGSTILIDINDSGTTILSTRLMIDASEKTSTTAATPAVISDTSLADDAEITIDFDQVGSTIAGKGVKVAIIGTRT